MTNANDLRAIAQRLDDDDAAHTAALQAATTDAAAQRARADELQAQVDRLTDPHHLDGWGKSEDRTAPEFWNVWDKTYVSFDWGYAQASQVKFSPEGIDLTIAKRPTPITAGGKSRSWDTPWLKLKPEHNWTYGRIEVEATLPDSANCPDGMWPAFWGMAQGGKGEIDLVEAWFPRFTRTRSTALLGTTTSTLHNYDAAGKHYQYGWTCEQTRDGARTTTPGNSWGTRHVWAVEKLPDSVRFLFDGQVVNTATRATHPGIFAPGFDGLPFDFRLCIAVGDGYWTNPPAVKATEVPKTMRVHRVTYWPTAD